MRYLIIILLPINLLFGQPREEEQWSIGLQSDYINIEKVGSSYTAGFNAEYMVNKYFGLQMIAAGGPNVAYFSGPFVLIPLGIIIGQGSSGSGKDMVSLMELLFWLSAIESPTFHLPLGEKLEAVFYLSFFRARYIWDAESVNAKNGWYASRSIGFKVNYFLNYRWLVSVYSEATQLYYSGRPKGAQTGISIGLLLKK